MINLFQHDEEQPEFQWAEEFFDRMLAISVAAVKLCCMIVWSVLSSLFSRKGDNSSEEVE